MSVSRRHFLTTISAVFAAPTLGMAQPALRVVATTGMIADTAREIGGDLIEVRALMGSGVDPHAYRQTRADIAAMSRADLVLWHGLYLEAQMEDFLLGLSRRTSVQAVGEAVDETKLIAHDDYDGRFDPHVWMSPRLWADVAEAIATALTAQRPDAAATFAANLTRFKANLDRLHNYAESTLTSVPKNARVLLTAHDAFGYFGIAFGYEVIGIQGISTESEAGLNRISELVDLLVSRDIKAVFVESSVSDRNMRALIEGTAAQGHIVTIGGELFSDAMGPNGTYEASYIGMMDHNVTTISRALGGTAPKRGLNNQLAAGS